MNWRRISTTTLIWVLLLAVSVAISACSKKDSDGIVGPHDEYWAGLFDWSDPAIWTDPSLWTDDKLRSFAYSGEPGHPDFYREDYTRGSPYYENTISIRSEADKWIELSTSSRDSAFAWSETSANRSSTYRYLESETETDKYFEFRRIRAEYPSDVILSRVHKISYLDRSMHDRFAPSAVLGVYGVRPIVATGARELVEYMWVNSRIVDFGRPLSRGLTENQDSFVEEIYYSYLIGGDWGTCDTIGIARALVRVDRASGEVTSTTVNLREVTGVCYE